MTGRLPKETSNGKMAPVPGLSAAAPYSSRLSARSGLYTELHQLLDAEHFALSSSDYRKRVVDENRLAKPSSAARAKLSKELKARYRLDADDPLFAAFWAEWKRCDSEAERGLTAYVLFALNDRLVTDLGTEWLYPLLRRAPAEIRVAEHDEVANTFEEPVDRGTLGMGMGLTDEIQELPNRDAFHLVAHVAALHERLEERRALEEIPAQQLPRRSAWPKALQMPREHGETRSASLRKSLDLGGTL